jgi:hypothetical protein
MSARLLASSGSLDDLRQVVVASLSERFPDGVKFLDDGALCTHGYCSTSSSGVQMTGGPKPAARQIDSIPASQRRIRDMLAVPAEQLVHALNCGSRHMERVDPSLGGHATLGKQPPRQTEHVVACVQDRHPPEHLQPSNAASESPAAASSKNELGDVKVVTIRDAHLVRVTSWCAAKTRSRLPCAVR